jgi:hypothetical protein
MTRYVGLDVSLKEIKLHVLDEAGHRVWHGRCATDPAAIAATVRRYAPSAAHNTDCAQKKPRDRRYLRMEGWTALFFLAGLLDRAAPARGTGCPHHHQQFAEGSAFAPT